VHIRGDLWSLDRRRKTIVANRIGRFSLLSGASFLYKILDCVSPALGTWFCAILLPSVLFAINVTGNPHAIASIKPRDAAQPQSVRKS